MPAKCRPWWRNCALAADAEILAVDALEDDLAPLSQNMVNIRELITSLELCHHKAEQWVENIIEAIGAGETHKGLGTRDPGSMHPAEQIWQDACTALSAWCSGQEADLPDTPLGESTVYELLHRLGQRTPLKEWQVQRLIERIRSFIHWPQTVTDPSDCYRFLLLDGGDYELAYVNECPECYRREEAMWRQTVTTVIHDTAAGQATELSLGLAIDLLMPCHWDFIGNLSLVLAAIGGDLHPQKPFAACGRNIERVPIRQRMEQVCHTLRFFCGDSTPAREADERLLALMGKTSAEKRWLALSLEKTIRLQLDPPAELRAVSALTGPDWLQQSTR